MGLDQLGPEQAVPQAIRAAVWERDLALAEQARDRFPPPSPQKRQLLLLCRAGEAGILALSGRPEAAAAYREVLRELRDAGLRFPHALATIDALLLLGRDDPEIRSSAGEAREFLTRVGARPFLERLDALSAAPERAEILSASAGGARLAPSAG